MLTEIKKLIGEDKVKQAISQLEDNKSLKIKSRYLVSVHLVKSGDRTK